MNDDRHISEEKRRALARGYADELVHAVDWLIAESQKDTSSDSHFHEQLRQRRQKAARRLRAG